MIDPYKKFKNWYNKASIEFNGDHTAFALGTCDNKLQPHIRMVLLKKISNDGFVFFTNLNSKKGNHFKINKNLSMCFYWENINRQIRILGNGTILDSEESDNYFSSRPRGSQIGAWASKQSKEIKSRKELRDKIKYYEKKFKNTSIPRPIHWSGIKIKPIEFEFWKQGEFRIHSREQYLLKKNNLTVRFLSP